MTSNTPDSLDSGKLLMAYGKICEEKGFMSDHAVQVRMDIMTAILDLESDKAAAIQAARVDELYRAQLVVEQSGASPELTKVAVALSERKKELEDCDCVSHQVTRTVESTLRGKG